MNSDSIYDMSSMTAQLPSKKSHESPPDFLSLTDDDSPGCALKKKKLAGRRGCRGTTRAGRSRSRACRRCSASRTCRRRTTPTSRRSRRTRATARCEGWGRPPSLPPIPARISTSSPPTGSWRSRSMSTRTDTISSRAEH
ncbi:hypothetical protein PR202_gb01868 [Eleusine coracana subsp. coracana]|uniref:Uncharacterized protein n=1 Tax=Eleusine coracana subsp. coracana TaxID=191504 RepID=A0AAV5DXR6_ELECO|nr:hypothetical protein PR202_gb01868 [Eleusine coracana subsp. coracana]